MCDDCAAKIAALPDDLKALCVASRLAGGLPHIFKSSGGSRDKTSSFQYVTLWHEDAHSWANQYELVSISTNKFMGEKLTLTWLVP